MMGSFRATDIESLSFNLEHKISLRCFMVQEYTRVIHNAISPLLIAQFICKLKCNLHISTKTAYFSRN